MRPHMSSPNSRDQAPRRTPLYPHLEHQACHRRVGQSFGPTSHRSAPSSPVPDYFFTLHSHERSRRLPSPSRSLPPRIIRFAPNASPPPSQIRLIGSGSRVPAIPMVQLTSSGKRHAEPGEPAMAPARAAAAATVKLETEVLGVEEPVPLSKRAKAAQPAPPTPPPQQVDPALSCFLSEIWCVRLELS
jgi:hypothetical protein